MLKCNSAHIMVFHCNIFKGTATAYVILIFILRFIQELKIFCWFEKEINSSREVKYDHYCCIQKEK